MSGDPKHIDDLIRLLADTTDPALLRALLEDRWRGIEYLPHFSAEGLEIL